MAIDKKSNITWSQPATPPPPMFAGEKERRLVKQINDEIIERVVGQQIAYFPIDVEKTNFHPLYGEAMHKVFGHPIRVYALVKFGGDNTKNEDVFGIDNEGTIEIHFHKRRLTEDQDLYVRVGDFVLYGDKYYELVDTSEPKQLFGQIENKFEIIGKCNRVREGTFDPSFVNNTVQTVVRTTSSSTGSASTYNPTSTGLFTNVIAQNNTTTNTLIVNSTTTFNGAIIYESVQVAGTYTVVGTDYYIGVNTSTIPASIILPSANTTTVGRTLTIKDETGNCATNNIVITDSSGNTIDGDSSYTIDTSYGSITLYCSSTGWHVI